jgi:hypothetical protein
MFGSVARDVERAKLDWTLHRDRPTLRLWMNQSKASLKVKTQFAFEVLISDIDWFCVGLAQMEKEIANNQTTTKWKTDDPMIMACMSIIAGCYLKKGFDEGQERELPCLCAYVKHYYRKPA